MLDFIVHLLKDPGSLVVWGGYPGLALVIFLETGGLCFFLPGDSLLVLAGFYAAKGDLHIGILNGLLITMAVLGDACSYYLGQSLGGALFATRKSRWLRPKHLQLAKDFYEKHGGKAIVLARFVPIVRTFIPVIAGIAKMGYRRFALYNMSGAALWVLSLTMVGYILGVRFPGLLAHIEKVVLVIVALSILPGVIEYFRARQRHKLNKQDSPL